MLFSFSDLGMFLYVSTFYVSCNNTRVGSKALKTETNCLLQDCFHLVPNQRRIGNMSWFEFRTQEVRRTQTSIV